MKKVLSIIVLSILVVSLVFSLVACKKKSGGGVTYDPNELRDKETSESIVDWVVFSADSSQEELKTLVSRIYDNACRLDQNVEYRRSEVVCSVAVTAMKMITTTQMQYVTSVKNGNEYYRGETQVPQGDTPKLLQEFSKDEIYFRGTYATLSSGKAITLETKSDISVEDNGTIHANLDAGSVSETEMPYFHSSQEPKYQQTDFVVRADTIYNVSISHNDKGYYVLEFNIDVGNAEAIAKPYANLSSSVKKAKYKSVREHIEIWDSGYFRYFQSNDSWEGKKGVDLVSDIDYRTYFYYQADRCNVDGCFGIAKLRAELAARE